MSEYTPRYLKAGDTIGILSPARFIAPHQVEPTVNWLKKHQFNVVLSPNIFENHHQMAGTDMQKIADFQQFINDPNIKAILCARGGYGSVRLVDRLDYTSLVNQKKWILGYSDITAFHTHIHQHTGLPTIHSTMPINITADGTHHETMSRQTLLDALMGNDLTYKLHNHPLNKIGNANGILVGGNLSILYSLCGSSSDLSTEGKILFLEDLDEHLYHIDRMMMNLKRTGKLNRLAGLVVGGMSDMNDNTIPFGKTAEEIILEHTCEYDYPIYFGLNAGHTQPNQALRLGMNVYIQDNTLFLPA